MHQIRSLGQEVINPDSEDSESIRYTAWRHALSIDSKRPWEIEDANANHTVHLVLQAESHTNRSSQAFSGLVSSPDNSLRKKVLSASDYPVPWSGPYHSSSMSPALSQSPSTLASIPHCRDGYEVDNLASHNQTPPVGLTQEAPTSSRSRRLCACNIAGSGLRTMQNTLDSFHLRPHTDNVISHAYDPDSSNWYPYTGGMGNTNDIYNQSYLNHNMQEPSRRWPQQNIKLSRILSKDVLCLLVSSRPVVWLLGRRDNPKASSISGCHLLDYQTTNRLVDWTCFSETQEHPPPCKRPVLVQQKIKQISSTRPGKGPPAPAESCTQHHLWSSTLGWIFANVVVGHIP